jgi:tetratricopeptide (TPR) repeat protein
MKNLFFILCLLFSQLSLAALPSELEELWQKRDEKPSLEAFLQKLEARPHTDVENVMYLTRGNFLLADVHTDDTDEKLKILAKAQKFGETIVNPKALDKVTLEQVDVLYWTAASLGKWAKANGIFSSIKYKDTILSMIKRVEALNPNYFYGSVPRYWGTYYAVAPSIAGGDMKKSKENYKKSIAMAPESLGTKVLMAEFYYAKEDDKKEFKKLLEEVLAAELGPKEIAPENRMEKKKAQKMLENIKDYF